MLPSLGVSEIEEIPEWRKGRPRAVMILAYCDESGDKDQSRVFAVAGIIGTEEDWHSAEKEWAKRTGGLEFHATDCEANRGNFKDYSPSDNKDLYKDLVKILAASHLWGIGSALDVQAYREIMPVPARDVPPYFACFQHVIYALGYLGSSYIPRQKIEFVFHRRVETHENASHYYSYLLRTGQMDAFSDIMSDKISSATSVTIGIQIADLFTREVMKDFEWRLQRLKGEKTRRRRLSWDALKATKRMAYGGWFREELKFLAHETLDADRKNGDQWLDYREWCARRGCNDNLQERIRFLSHGATKKR